MKWTVTFYSGRVRDDLLELPSQVQARLIRMLEMIEDYGPNLGMPHTRAMKDGLFEIRAKASDGTARAFFCTQVGREIVILHIFLKKSQKTPTKELKLAKARLKEMKP